jgi:hypothetical protein
MPTELERDAALFFEQLYGIEPGDGLLISLSTFKPFRQEFCSDVGEALAYVIGHADIYSRVTLLSRPVPGRGKKEDSAAMPAVWMELDVSGGPRSNGGTVEDAFGSVDQALEFAGRVLMPTMIVRSGYGIHCYWLLERLLRLETDRARAQAEELVRAWQAQMRRLAGDELGVRHFDSSHDLTRVLRPVGSVNAKGDLPQEVVLEDFSGTRYSVDELSAHVEAETGPRSTGGAAEHGHSPRGRAGARRSPADLLETFPKLEQIARRRGKAPTDSSRSGWDHYLGCEAARCGASNDEIIAIIRHGRSLRGEEDELTDAYLERTLEAVRAKVATDGNEELGLSVAKRWNAQDDPIVDGELIGPGEDAIVWLERRSGDRLRLGSVRGLFSARTHNRVVSVATGTRFPALTDKEAVDITQQIIQICKRSELDAADLTAEWLGNFYERAGSTVTAKMETTDDRRGACKRRKSAEAQLDRHGDIASRTAVILDDEGQVWIPSGPFRASLSPGAPSWRELEALVAEIGWRREKIELWANPGREDRGEHIKVVFYVGKP